MSSVNDLIAQINKISGFNIPSSSLTIPTGSTTTVQTSSLFDTLIGNVNTLGGINVPIPSVMLITGSQSVYNVSPTASDGTISTEGIYPGAVIKSEQVLRIINALNGTEDVIIIVSGSLLTSGSNVLNGSLALPFLNEGDILQISGGLVQGASQANFTASYAISSSHALDSDRAITASYALFSEYGTGVIGATATLNQTTPSTIWNFNHRLGTEYPVVTIYDTATNSVIIPTKITPLDSNNLQITFSSPRAGHAVAVVGGGYFATTSGSTRQLNQNTPATTWRFNHGLGDQYPVFQVYNTASTVIYPAGIYALDLYNAEIYFNTPTAGIAIATVGGLVNNTASYATTASYALLALTASYFSGSISNALSASYALTASYALNITTPSALVAGDIQAQVSIDPNSIFLIKSGSNTVFNVDQTGNIITNGSISLETTGSYLELISIKNNGTEYAKVNGEGVLVLHQYSTPPTASAAGMYFDTTGNFYVGL